MSMSLQDFVNFRVTLLQPGRRIDDSTGMLKQSCCAWSRAVETRLPALIDEEVRQHGEHKKAGSGAAKICRIGRRGNRRRACFDRVQVGSQSVPRDAGNRLDWKYSLSRESTGSNPPRNRPLRFEPEFARKRRLSAGRAASFKQSLQRQ